MRYMILIHSDDVSDRAWAGGELAELDRVHRAVISELRASGEFVDTNELDVEDAVVIGRHNGAPIVTRGPFTEGTEWVGGYYVVDVADRERAVEIARRFAESKYSPIEIRRVVHSSATS
jgi:hypothetical protein